MSIFLLCISAACALSVFVSVARDWLESFKAWRWKNSRENYVKLRRVTRTRLFNPHRTNMMGH